MPSKIESNQTKKWLLPHCRKKRRRQHWWCWWRNSKSANFLAIHTHTCEHVYILSELYIWLHAALYADYNILRTLSFWGRYGICPSNQMLKYSLKICLVKHSCGFTTASSRSFFIRRNSFYSLRVGGEYNGRKTRKFLYYSNQECNRVRRFIEPYSDRKVDL